MRARFMMLPLLAPVLLGATPATTTSRPADRTRAKAVEILNNAIALVPKAEGAFRDEALEYIAHTHALLGQYDVAMKYALMIKNPVNRHQAFIVVASAQFEADLPDAATDTLKAFATEIATGKSESTVYDNPLLLRVAARYSDFEIFMSKLKDLGEWKCMFLCEVAERQWNEGDKKAARKSFQQAVALAEDDPLKLSSISGYQARVGDLDSAAETARKIKSPSERARSLASVVLDHAEKKNSLAMKKLINEAIEDLKADPVDSFDNWRNARSWNDIGEAYAIAGDLPAAKNAWQEARLQALRKTPEGGLSPESLAEILGDIAAEQQVRGDPEGAKAALQSMNEALGQITDGAKKNETLARIASGRADAEDFQGAREIVVELLGQKNVSPGLFASHNFQHAIINVASSHKPEPDLSLIEKLPTPATRAMTYAHLAYDLVHNSREKKQSSEK